MDVSLCLFELFFLFKVRIISDHEDFVKLNFQKNLVFWKMLEKKANILTFYH